MHFDFKFLGHFFRFGPYCPLFLLFIIGCVREVEIKLPEYSSKLVAVSHFSPDTSFFINVRLSGNGFDTPPELPESTVVRLIDDEENIEDLKSLIGSSGRFWQNRNQPKANVTYRIEIVSPGYPTLTGTSSVPESVPITASIIAERDTFQLYQLVSGSKVARKPLQIRLPDSSNSNYFAFNIRYEREDTIDNFIELPRAQILTDPVTQAHLFDISEGVWLVHDEFWKTHKGLDIDLFLEYQPNFYRLNRVIVEWMTLSPEYYHYHLSLARQGNPNLPFNSPDKLYTNLSGGFGTFSGFQKSTYPVSL
jgi:Domain of unknown function (DUF4249)